MSNNKQQTAVEWLFNEITLQYVAKGNLSFMDIVNMSQQAKEMEKIEKQNYLKAYFDWHKQMGFVSHKPEDIIEFNETYGGNK
jgi:hypothetical protein